MSAGQRCWNITDTSTPSPALDFTKRCNPCCSCHSSSFLPVCRVSPTAFCFIRLFVMDISCPLLPPFSFQTFLGELSPCSCSHQKSAWVLSYQKSALSAYHTVCNTTTRLEPAGGSQRGQSSSNH